MGSDKNETNKVNDQKRRGQPNTIRLTFSLKDFWSFFYWKEQKSQTQWGQVR